MFQTLAVSKAINCILDHGNWAEMILVTSTHLLVNLPYSSPICWLNGENSKGQRRPESLDGGNLGPHKVLKQRDIKLHPIPNLPTCIGL